MEILLWPHDALKRVCSPVVFPDPELKGQLADMKIAMLAAGGIGLAANQVGIDKRMLIARDNEGRVRAFINPRIVKFTGFWKQLQEGCLSLPGVRDTHLRNTALLFEYQDEDTGAMVVDTASGQLAHILQHEIDHLNGKMMIDVWSPGRRDQLRASLRKGRR